MIKKTKQQLKLEAQQEMWFRGILTFMLHAGQKIIDQQYRQIKKKLFLANCSRQWGKSFWAVIKALEMALSKPNAQIKYGAAFYKDLIKYIIPAFDKALQFCPESIKGKKVGDAYRFPNGSIIDLVGIDLHPDSMRGNSLDLIIVDEAAYVTKLDYLYKSVIMPATLHRPNAKIIFISSPPSTPDHPYLEYVEKAQLEGSYACFDIYKNPMVTPETILTFIEESGGEKSTTWRREYLCQFVTDASSAIIPEWDDKYIQEAPKDEFYGWYHRYTSMDLGVKHFTAIIFGYYNFRTATLIIEDEVHLNGPTLTTPMIVENIKTIENRLWGEPPPYRRISDNNNLQLIQDMAELHKLIFIPTSKDTLEAMINELRIMITKGRILINPKCKQLIGCLQNGIWDSKKKHFALSAKYGHYDALAALIYLVRNLVTNVCPIPPNLGFFPDTHWIPKTPPPPLAKAIFPSVKHPNSRDRNSLRK